MLDWEEKALSSALEVTGIRKRCSARVCVYIYSQKVRFALCSERLWWSCSCYDDTVSISSWMPHYAGQYRTDRQTHTQSLIQNECLSINGSWQNRLSQAWKSTWIPTRLELDALMRRCLRPVSTSPYTPSHSGVESHATPRGVRNLSVWEQDGSQVIYRVTLYRS